MYESDIVCVKTNASIRIGSRGTIFKVSLYTAAHMAELTPDLMVTPGEKLDFNEMVSVRAI